MGFQALQALIGELRQIILFLIGDHVLEQRARLVRFALQNRNWSVLR